MGVFYYFLTLAAVLPVSGVWKSKMHKVSMNKEGQNLMIFVQNLESTVAPVMKIPNKSENVTVTFNSTTAIEDQDCQ